MENPGVRFSKPSLREYCFSIALKMARNCHMTEAEFLETFSPERISEGYRQLEAEDQPQKKD